MQKKELRKIYTEKRLLLSEETCLLHSSKVLNLFKTISLGRFSTVLTYYPLIEKNEFDVACILEYLKEKEPNLKISWPKINIANNSFEAFQVNNQYGFEKNKFNIPEPLNGIKTNPESIDIVLVPLLVFNDQGFRVGYGKGYYDRFLPLCKPDVIKIGFSFFEPVPLIEDIHHFDVPLNYCITPTKVYEF